MSYDKYRNWDTRPLSRGWSGTDIKKQVLLDLAATSDETDKLEILDSYEVYVQRCFIKQIAGAMSQWVTAFFAPFIAGAIQNQLGNPMPSGRARRVPQEEKNADLREHGVNL
jgi:hypothetical protein